MSKSPNILIPALSGTALVLGVTYGVMSRDYASDEIAALETQVEQSSSTAADAVANAREADAQIELLLAERNELQAIAAAGGGLTEPAPVAEAAYSLGRPALPEEIAAWDVDVMPDGRGLPVGSGDVWTGEEVFVEQCASCHGDFAEGSGNWPVLAGGFGTLDDEDPVKTIGSYWPHLSTSWDYINRSMPFGNAGTLTADETYAIVAYILYSNDMVDDDFVLSDETFLEVEMLDSVEITMRASVVDVTPETEETEAMAEPMESHDADVVQAGADPALIDAGKGVFRQCQACHQVGPDADNRSGPHLNGLLGRTIGSIDGFRYSNVFKDAAAAGDVWNDENLAAFLADPRGAMSGTKMTFRGLSDAEDIAAVVAYIESIGAE